MLCICTQFEFSFNYKLVNWKITITFKIHKTSKPMLSYVHGVTTLLQLNWNIISCWNNQENKIIWWIRLSWAKKYTQNNKEIVVALWNNLRCWGRCQRWWLVCWYLWNQTETWAKVTLWCHFSQGRCPLLLMMCRLHTGQERLHLKWRLGYCGDIWTSQHYAITNFAITTLRHHNTTPSQTLPSQHYAINGENNITTHFCKPSGHYATYYLKPSGHDVFFFKYIYFFYKQLL